MPNDAMTGKVVMGRYRIVAPLARGGMGIVYLGRLEGAAGFSKPVVIKSVLPDSRDEGAARLFAREARILANLQHPNIVGVLDFGEVGGEYIMVLEYVHGFHLGLWHRYVRRTRGDMRIDHAVEVMLPILDALEYAHTLKRPDGNALGIVHRDVSPANILIDQNAHVKLHDFGIARIADDEFKTQDGAFRGTLSYAAPETLQGIAAQPRSDLYATGVILYQLLSGANPFFSDQPSGTLHRVLTHVPPRLGTLRDGVSAELDAALARAMEKDPARRFASAAEFAAALRGARDWSESAALTSFAQVIQEDFGGPEMSQALGVDSLESRDASWRASQPGSEQLPLQSSRPPKGGPEVTAADALTVRDQPSPALLARTARAATAAAAAATATATAAPIAAPAGPSRKLPLWPLATFALVLGLGGVAYGLLRGEAKPPQPRFVLIEKQSEAENKANDATSATADVALAPIAVASAPSSAATAARLAPASKPVAAASSASQSPAATLTAAFQRQRGKVEGCFLANPNDSAEKVTLRFQVEANGTVRSADLQPSALSASPLGHCILGVARQTTFPPGAAPISFTIPITARKTSH